MSGKASTNNFREGISAQDTVTGKQILLTGTNNGSGQFALNINGTGGGGGSDVQYVELITTAPATGTLALGRYKSAAPTLTDGQMYGLQLDASGNLKVTGSLSVGGTTDAAAWTTASSTFNPSGGVFNDTATALTSGQQGTERLTPNRALHINIRNNSGTELATSGNPLRVDPTGTTTQPISAASLPLPAGAALDVTLTGGTQQSKITDGTTVVTVKAASTAAIAADKALVVAISPNNTVPVSLATNTPTLQSGSTTAVTQPTGTNLHMVVDSGTITTVSAVTAITNALPAGSAVIGKFGIDQTTPGTTNLVALAANQTVNNTQVSGTAISVNNGVTDAGTQRVTLSSDSTGQVKLATGANTVGAVTAPGAAALALDATLTGGTQQSKITDGTNIATVKAASTAAVATDKALVVAISPNNPLTTSPADNTATGSITTQNLAPTGTATAGSAVQTTALAGFATASIQVTGTYTGALSAQATVDGTNWVTLGGTPFLNINTGVYSATIASAAVGIFQADVAAFKQFRITGLAAMTGTAVVSIQASNGAGMVALDAPLPPGTNVVGALSANQSVNTAQVNGVTPLMGNGTTGTGSQRVTVASDNTPFPIKIDQTTVGTTNAISLAQIGATTVATGNGVVGTGVQRVAIASDNTAFAVNATLQTGANVIGALTANQSVNNAQIAGVTVSAGNGVSGTGVQRVTLASDSTGQTAPAANATATGLSISYTAAFTATKVAVNASAGNFYGYHIYNPNSAVVYVQLFNVALASVTLGTTAPNMVLAVPAGGWVDAQMTVPITFATALTAAATTTAGGLTAPTSALTANFFFK